MRTPWSLASERVWNATHRLAAKTFVLGELAGLALIAMVRYACLVATRICGLLIPVIYSLYCYKQLQRRGDLCLAIR